MAHFAAYRGEERIGGLAAAASVGGERTHTPI
jgi:hypothetical protein